MIKILDQFPDYGVSEDGKIFSYKSGEPIELQKINHSFDYDIVNLSSPSLKGGQMTMLVHQLVMAAFGPDRPRPYTEYVITHHDGDKKNNHISNLAWIRKTEIRANKTKPIRAIGVDEGDKILFRTTSDAARYFHTNQVKIKEVCISKLPWKGYTFEYIL
jgi:hypothetical protein